VMARSPCQGASLRCSWCCRGWNAGTVQIQLVVMLILFRWLWI